MRRVGNQTLIRTNNPTLRNGIRQFITNQTRKCTHSIEEQLKDTCLFRPKKVHTVRWGIAPVSKIADDFVTALRVLPDQHHKVMACAANYWSVAKSFAERHQIAEAYTSFDELASSEEIDVVYVSSLNPWHMELGRLMLSHGKHVLCEKPLCMNQDQAIQLIGHSHTKRLFLMEGMFSRFMPAYNFVRQQIENEAMGDVSEVECSYGVPLLDVERVAKRCLGGGVTLELGPYAIQLAQWVFRRYPHKIKASGKLNEDSVDISATIEIGYGCGRRAKIVLSAMEKLENVARIKGEKGTMTIPEFWCPTTVIGGKQERKFDLPQLSDSTTNFPNRVALCYEAEEVRRCLLSRKNQSQLYNHNETLLIARIVDEARKQLGVVYPEDRPENDCG